MISSAILFSLLHNLSESVCVCVFVCVGAKVEGNRLLIELELKLKTKFLKSTQRSQEVFVFNL